jgi:hypothetical protein
MRFTNRFTIFVIATAVLVLGFTFLSTGARAQNDSWWIVRAEYGTRSQHNDVTEILKDLIGRGGVNGHVAVNNQTMGGDPAVGADKHLRIIARNNRNEEHEFEFKEGGFIDAAMFAVRREERRDDWNDRPPASGDRDRDDNGLRIIRAYYGIQGRTVNVTDLLRRNVRERNLTFPVSNDALGGDPAVGANKVLIVVYSYRGMETATAVPEGGTLSLP